MKKRDPIEVHERLVQAFNAGDLDGLMALYEPDAVSVSEDGQSKYAGLEAIREEFRAILTWKARMELQTVYVIENGDLALLRSRWRLVGTGPDGKPLERTSSSVEVARRQPDGTWRYIIDHPFGAA